MQLENTAAISHHEVEQFAAVEEAGVQDVWREVMAETRGREIHNAANMVAERRLPIHVEDEDVDRAMTEIFDFVSEKGDEQALTIRDIMVELAQIRLLLTRGCLMPIWQNNEGTSWKRRWRTPSADCMMKSTLPTR